MSLEFPQKMKTTLKTEVTQISQLTNCATAEEEAIRRKMAASSKHMKPRPASAQPTSTQDLTENRKSRPKTAPSLYHTEEVQFYLPGSCESVIISSTKKSPRPQETMSNFSSDGDSTFTSHTIDIDDSTKPGQCEVTELEYLTPQKTVTKNNNNTQAESVPSHKQKKECPVHLFYVSSVDPQKELDEDDVNTPPTQKSQAKSDSSSGKASGKNFFQDLWKKVSPKHPRQEKKRDFMQEMTLELEQAREEAAVSSEHMRKPADTQDLTSPVDPQNSKNSSALDKDDVNTPPTQKSPAKSDSSSGKASSKNFFKDLWKKVSPKHSKQENKRAFIPEMPLEMEQAAVSSEHMRKSPKPKQDLTQDSPININSATKPGQRDVKELDLTPQEIMDKNTASCKMVQGNSAVKTKVDSLLESSYLQEKQEVSQMPLEMEQAGGEAAVSSEHMRKSPKPTPASAQPADTQDLRAFIQELMKEKQETQCTSSSSAAQGPTSSAQEPTDTFSNGPPPPTPSSHLPPPPPPFSWDSAWFKAFFRYRKEKLLDFLYDYHKPISITVIFCIGGLIVLFCCL